MGKYWLTRRFYEENPYPLQRVISRKDLLRNGHARVMERILSTVGWNFSDLEGKMVLDAGCGTGEKALFCSLMGAKVDAFDISSTSVRIARANAKRLGLKLDYRVGSFEDFSSNKKYDLVLCIGSLHHSSDPRGNFKRMASFLAPGGRIVLGLYNPYGRLYCRLKRKLLWLGESEYGGVMKKIGAQGIANATLRSSLADRYASPHETHHSVGEALSWFSGEGVSPFSSFPKVKLGSHLHMAAAQLDWLVKGRGFFFVGGMKRA